DYVNYKIQVSASNRLIETKSYNFNGLESIEVFKEGSLYKYLYGNYRSLEEAKKQLKYVKKFGFNSSFVIGFRNNRIIPLSKLN
ncbi:MAG TPA: SPOR domain-containing protein, partial [Flavobacteriaceae bacterium]|nr:SPOR domain-containing protein [Flavobacteriaceae bacterium]